jgi:hypothetical protein
VSRSTAQQRNRCWDDFRAAEPAAVAAVEAGRPVVRELAIALVRWGQLLHDSGAAISRFRNTLLATQDRAPEVCGQLRRAWRALSQWQALEPSDPHPPMPRSLLAAMVSVAVVAELGDFAAFLLLGWVALLRPGEALRIRRRDLIFPEEIAAERELLFVALQEHKTRHGRTLDGPQHGVVRDPLVISYLRAVVRRKRADHLVVALTHREFLRTWRGVLAALGTSGWQRDGFPPSSLRAGGATWLYMANCPRPEVSWRLRHGSEGSVRHYIQQAAAALGAARLSRQAKERIEHLAPRVTLALRMRAVPPPPVDAARFARLPAGLRSDPLYDRDVFAGL